MNNKARIALDLRGVTAVIMNAMTIEGQRRVAEQERRRGVDLALMRARLGGCWRFGRPTRIGTAVDNVLALLQCDSAAGFDPVPHRHEAERARPALLQHDIGNARDAPDRVADPD